MTYSEAVCHAGQHKDRVYTQRSYSAMSGHTQRAQTWSTQFYLQITPCLPTGKLFTPYIFTLVPDVTSITDTCSVPW